MVASASVSDVLSIPQTGESWNRCVRPKAIGAWNLHELTKALPNLEQFVLFSSIVCWVGHQGARSLLTSLLLCTGFRVEQARGPELQSGG